MVNKITNNITPLDEIDKINEIIDNLGDTITVDQTYNASSLNAQSGVAINGAKFIRNTATGINALTIDGTASSATSALNIGAASTAGGGFSVAVGYYTASNGARTTSIGYGARIGGSTPDAIQIGNGTNSTAKSLSVGFYNSGNYQLLDGTTGKIPNDRIKYDGTTITVNSNGELTSTGSGGASRNIGEIITSTIPLTDAGLHLLDGALVSGSGSYSEFVTYIAGLRTSYSSLFTTESNWQSTVTQYGVCGKFVYDSTNNTVRLPKYNSKIYTGGGTAPILGNGMSLGLTDGTVNYGLSTNYNPANIGCLTYSAADYGTNVGSTAHSQAYPAKTIGITTDSSKSGIIAQLSDITTSLDGYYYIVVATSTKTDIQVDIDEITTDLNGKADVDLSNMNASQTAKNTIVGWGMPDLTAGVGWYHNGTAVELPCDALVTVAVVGGGSWVGANLYVNGNLIISNASIYGCSVSMVLPKGSRVSGDATYQHITYYPLKGVN